jgi:hypothetical protein
MTQHFVSFNLIPVTLVHLLLKACLPRLWWVAISAGSMGGTLCFCHTQMTFMRRSRPRGWGYSSVAECVLSMCEALCLITGTERERERERERCQSDFFLGHFTQV